MVISERRLARILLVDDSLAEISLMQALIRRDKLQFHLECERDGAVVVRSLRQEVGGLSAQAPDLLLLDINMPTISGFDILQQVRADHILKDFPIVMYSGSESVRDKEVAATLGASGYIQKPLSLAKLQQVIAPIPGLEFSSESEGAMLERVPI